MPDKQSDPNSESSRPAGGATESQSKRVPSLVFNLMSLIGILLVAIGFFTGVFTFLLDSMSDFSPAYLGILYVVYLLLIVLGFLIIPIGMLRERQRRKPGGAPSLPGLTADLVIDLRRPRHRATVLIFLIGGAFLTIGMAVGSYKTYQTTDSNAFCGQLCHSVMTPEYTTYRYSPHARVKCVECHIGEGAEWYVKSKISGVRQIVAVNLNTYPRPIPTPIENLRPARETCEQCHWPTKFIGFREMTRTYFLSDEENTAIKIRMLLKIGGEDTTLMKGSGIHYHMIIANKVQYIARDAKRQEIPFVRITRSDGSVTEFNDTKKPLTEAEKKSMTLRTMDCMDCHNRPSHRFPSPMHTVDDAMEAGSLPTDLPYLKVRAVKALSEDYQTDDEAIEGITASLTDFYKEVHPKVYEDKKSEVERTIAELLRLYQTTQFPEMKAKWSAYPDNIGHRDFPGCFRCHNDRLESAKGETIFTDCTKCHLILAEGKDIDNAQVNFQSGQAFIHPEDGEPMKEFTECTDCHTGGSDLYD